MSIRRRILYSFGGIIILFGMAVAVYLWTANLRTETMTLDHALKRQVLIGYIRQDVDNLHKQVALLGEMEFGNGQAATSPEMQRSFHQHVEEVFSLLGQLQKLTEWSEQPQISEIQKTYGEVAAAWKGFYSYLGVEQTWALANIVKADPLSFRLQTELLPNFEKAEQERVARAETRFNLVQKWTFRLSLAIFFVSGLLATVVAFAITRRISRGFTTLKQGTDLIGGMNLDHRIDLPSKDELGDFARSFNVMADRLLAARNELTAANVELERRAEEIAVRQQRELEYAATIQQALMQVRMPDIPFAQLIGRNLSCTQIGGDFFDVVQTTEGLAVIIADVSGKGISAAIMASMIQGMIRSELVAQQPISKVVESVNWYFTQRDVGGKYATVSIVRLTSEGRLEYVNCGHIPPVLIRGGQTIRLKESANVPVGLLPNRTFETAFTDLLPGDRIILVTDGVTEAANAEEEFFGEERLEVAAACTSPFANVFKSLHEFCAGTPFNDDCTVVELTYTGEGVATTSLESALARVGAEVLVRTTGA
jgi:serine phosphatase RsbU (regulator of sigma subunit)